MKRKFLTAVFFFAILFLTAFNGCITFHKVSYDVKLTSPNEGSVLVTAYDIRSTANTSKEFDDDKNTLFRYMLKSKQFPKDQKEQGKEIISRKLYVEDGKLIGRGEYKFTDISKVEGMKFEDGFHYINLNLEDSVISTNGEIIKSKEFKRIVWDSTFTELKFTMLGNSFSNHTQYKLLAPYYNQKKMK